MATAGFPVTQDTAGGEVRLIFFYDFELFLLHQRIS